ncbi:hypothetical protein AXF42_Ash014155 [Apostasia shenzhenica]|uniref:Multicopper oxidase LPR1 n=1 Tax=Apostasia shenzhenica TaxID=1088818 RepID=A0A2I0A129_9ASPA|nr:hypothetical protein AXF42_Ash014155 [Apostasia shenzhenica]
MGHTHWIPNPSASPGTEMVKFAVITLIILAVCTSASAGSIRPRVPPVTEAAQEKIAGSLQMYVDRLPQMPKLYAYTFEKGSLLVPINLTIGMFSKKWKFHRDLPATPVFVYGTSAAAATFPGPTIETLQGLPLWVTWQNHLPSSHILPWDPTIHVAAPASGGVPAVVHLHGGVHQPQSDGNPLAWFTAGFRDTGSAWSTPTFFYANDQQPGNLWYHDHALGFTRVNLLAGLLGAYVIRNRSFEPPLRLPSGPEFDLHLVLVDRSFAADGSIYMNSTGDNPSIHSQWQPEYYGDAIVVNGKAWPFLDVRRRRYRFRILNASNARFFRLSLSNGLPFTVIGSDTSYLPTPVIASTILVSPAEIFDVVIDFSKSKSPSAELLNSAPYPYPGGSALDSLSRKVMKFNIVTEASAAPDESMVPAKLTDYPRPELSEAAVRRYITMYEYDAAGGPTHLFINGKRFEDPVTETPAPGSTEVWEVINLTPDSHPLHIHLAFSQAVAARELVNLTEFSDCMTKENDAVRCGVAAHAVGKVVETPEHERTWKNVVKIDPGLVTTVVVRFKAVDRSSPYPFDSTAEPGYVYHCHILDHEDNAMIRPLKLIR